jgi:hypothetical protein
MLPTSAPPRLALDLVAALLRGERAPAALHDSEAAR